MRESLWRDWRALTAEGWGAGVAGAVSRTATAPVDRMKLLLQVDSTARGLTVREGWNRMVAEGGPAPRPDIPLT